MIRHDTAQLPVVRKFVVTPYTTKPTCDACGDLSLSTNRTVFPSAKIGQKFLEVSESRPVWTLSHEQLVCHRRLVEEEGVILELKLDIFPIV